MKDLLPGVERIQVAVRQLCHDRCSEEEFRQPSGSVQSRQGVVVGGSRQDESPSGAVSNNLVEADGAHAFGIVTTRRHDGDGVSGDSDDFLRVAGAPLLAPPEPVGKQFD